MHALLYSYSKLLRDDNIFGSICLLFLATAVGNPMHGIYIANLDIIDHNLYL